MKKTNKKTKKGICKFKKVFDLKYLFLDFLKFLFFIPCLLDLRIKRVYKTGKKPKGYFKGKYILASNHTSFEDPVILTAAFFSRRLSFIATKEIFARKFWGIIMILIRAIKIDKENIALSTFKEVSSTLEHGHIVAIFPEGHVELKEGLDTYKSGAILMAIMNNVDLMPVYLHKRKNRFKRQIVVYGERLDLSKYLTLGYPSVEDIEKITLIVKEKEEELRNIALNIESKKGRK